MTISTALIFPPEIDREELFRTDFRDVVKLSTKGHFSEYFLSPQPPREKSVSRQFNNVPFGRWADAIKEMALRSAVKRLREYLDGRYRPGPLSRMNPGSLPDWPLPEQRPLFDLLGEGPAGIGVELTESFLMRPVKSVSGIWFPTEENFESCRLCPRENCPGRRAPHDPGLYDRKYRP